MDEQIGSRMPKINAGEGPQETQKHLINIRSPIFQQEEEIDSSTMMFLYFIHYFP